MLLIGDQKISGNVAYPLFLLAYISTQLVAIYLLSELNVKKIDHSKAM